MLFNSFKFLIFLPIVFITYWLLKDKYRWLLILISSYYFYMSWNVKYIALILFTTVISYVCAIYVEKFSTKKRILLISALTASFGVLFFYKYFNFFSNSIIDSLNMFAIHINPITLKLLLPVGISFYTFQTLSYVIDVYKGEVPAEHHFGKYAAFISFFPQLVAGPIERTKNLLPQINSSHKFNYDQASYGLKIMLWGYFKKVLIADTLAIYVDKVYNNISSYKGFVLIIATILFAFQIYCDFSGYSDIAVGTAKLFGINLMTNFKSPYFSSSVKEFWKRWHISLSTWFRDYVYIPLGGNRVSKFRHDINIMITFIISGLWHGANWTFVIWGAVHGFGQVLESHLFIKKKKKNSLNLLLSTCIVFIFCCFAWIFFRSSSLSDAIYVIRNMFAGISSPIAYINLGYISLGWGAKQYIPILLCLLILMIYEFYDVKRDVITLVSNYPIVFRWLLYIVFIIIIVILTPSNVNTPFLYFQF